LITPYHDLSRTVFWGIFHIKSQISIGRYDWNRNSLSEYRQGTLVLPISRAVILDKVISVKAAAEFSGYSSQYLRRLLRLGKFAGLTLGRV
jgi:hypothetical protein